MKTLADLKRAVNAPDTIIRVVSHWQPQLVGTTRKPFDVQTNGYWFMGPQLADNRIVRMWAPFPKASQLRFNEDGTVTFFPDEKITWTQAFEKEVQPQ